MILKSVINKKNPRDSASLPRVRFSGPVWPNNAVHFMQKVQPSLRLQHRQCSLRSEQFTLISSWQTGCLGNKSNLCSEQFTPISSSGCPEQFIFMPRTFDLHSWNNWIDGASPESSGSRRGRASPEDEILCGEVDDRPRYRASRV